ncbi:Uncharacterized protein JA1_000243 [Spathaspora sp. JA1]|nr:Uncharacterized protein JA1_000243 [Spathaspora sp. JA1]
MTQYSSPETRPIRNAGCLIIGDEILNGKILDTNSYNFARYCFNNLSIPLKRTIVCGDSEKDIVDSLNILLKQDQLDLVITSGGLGSTHDDITYKAIADYFDLDYRLDQEVVDRMHRVRGDYLADLKPDQLSAFYKMATLPVAKGNSSSKVEKYFIGEDLWFPLVALNDQVYILPGIPQLFTRLIDEMEPYLKKRIEASTYTRKYVQTTTKESELAPFLSSLQDRCNARFGPDTIKLGSYPHMNWHINTISIIGIDIDAAELQKIVEELVENIGGQAKEITEQQEDYLTNEDPK